jgi:hypothetical protein
MAADSNAQRIEIGNAIGIAHHALVLEDNG